MAVCAVLDRLYEVLAQRQAKPATATTGNQTTIVISHACTYLRTHDTRIHLISKYFLDFFHRFNVGYILYFARSLKTGFHNGGPGSIPEQSISDFSCKQWHIDMFLWGYFGLTQLMPSRECTILIHLPFTLYRLRY